MITKQQSLHFSYSQKLLSKSNLFSLKVNKLLDLINTIVRIVLRNVIDPKY